MTGAPASRSLLSPAAPHDRLDASQQFVGMARLSDPVIRAEPQSAHALGDGRRTGADEHRHPRKPVAHRLEIGPSLRAEHLDVDHERIEAHRDEDV